MKFLIGPALALMLMPVSPLAAEQTGTGGEFRFWLLDPVETLDPANAVDRGADDAVRNLFEGLLNEAPDGTLLPGVASGYSESDDGLRYVFTLRPQARWSDGVPVTAQDFVHAWRRLADPATGAELGWYVADVMRLANADEIRAGQLPPEDLGVVAMDDHRLEITLLARAPWFPRTLTHVAAFPLPRHVADGGGVTGNGAFMLESNGPDGISMIRNPAYWDAENVAPDRLSGIVENDQTAALALYRAGGIDRVQVAAGQLERLRAELPAETVVLPVGCTYGYILNLSESGPPALADPAIRRALDLLTDRETIAGTVLGGGQQPAGSWTHWAISGFVAPARPQDDPGPAGRAAEAAQLLEAAGITPETPLRLTLNYNTLDDHRRIAAAIQQMWRPYGIMLRLNNLDWRVHEGRMKAQEFELARFGWCADYDDPAAFLDYFRRDGVNAGRFDNPAYDALLDDALIAADPAARYTAAEAILARELPMIAIYHYARAELIRPGIGGIARRSALGRWYGKDIRLTAP
ncbi:MAG: peptide ABC transporter substrate-binding protein [Paracoccus sp. (in: a-proteobacteria)]|nr:peptide ABC transporter substrate-binding protein [Paracoccus sp. (in: a-proteobacteria)]